MSGTVNVAMVSEKRELIFILAEFLVVTFCSMVNSPVLYKVS
jgi:hypothetical protein